jgi:hypothetical protein
MQDEEIRKGDVNILKQLKKNSLHLPDISRSLGLYIPYNRSDPSLNPSSKQCSCGMYPHIARDLSSGQIKWFTDDPIAYCGHWIPQLDLTWLSVPCCILCAPPSRWAVTRFLLLQPGSVYTSHKLLNTFSVWSATRLHTWIVQLEATRCLSVAVASHKLFRNVNKESLHDLQLKHSLPNVNKLLSPLLFSTIISCYQSALWSAGIRGFSAEGSGYQGWTLVTPLSIKHKQQQSEPSSGETKYNTPNIQVITKL